MFLFKNKENFHTLLQKISGCDFCLETSFGRIALYTALKAINVIDKEILVPIFICNSVVDAIVNSGAKPVFIDINPNDFTIDLSDAEKKITKKTKAILFVHYFGYVYPKIQEIQSFAQKNNLLVIEDCAHSLGAFYKDKPVGSFGDISIFSFTKNITGFGGGAICTNNEDIYLQLKNEINEKRQYQNNFLKFIYTLIYYYKVNIDQLLFDRPSKSIFKWWLINLPDVILKPIKYSKDLDEKMKGAGINNRYDKIFNFTPSMNLFGALVNKRQIQKLRSVNEKRHNIAEHIRNSVPNLIHEINDYKLYSNVYTFLILKAHKLNINETIEWFRKKGICVRTTWPVFQKQLPEQKLNKNIQYIADNFVLLRISPNLNKHDLDYLIYNLKHFQNGTNNS